MPGRPRRMAKRVTELEDQALTLSVELFVATPAQYRNHPDPSDRVNEAWNDALSTATLLSIKMERLGDLIRSKAGITEPGPSAEFFSKEPEGPKRRSRSKVSEPKEAADTPQS